mmetsp:Transcript_64639/g.140762  ORF Transcript_64639/g.140762 Transcript_64639/m.140762 type:complete len:194 (-) Transcript_64639:100-681(-)
MPDGREAGGGGVGGDGGGSGQGIGSAAANLASHGAKATHRGFVAVSTAVQHNPAIVKIVICLIGILITVGSILHIFGVVEQEEGNGYKEHLQNVYLALFGLVIAFCDMPSDFANAGCGLQTKLFHYCHLLATQTGRAFFYFYVGSIIIFMLPESTFWKMIYFICGGTLCVLGLLVLLLRWCPWCRHDPVSGSA